MTWASDHDGCCVRTSAAAAETSGAANDVPSSISIGQQAPATDTAGAARSIHGPNDEKSAKRPDQSVPETATTPGYAAG